MTRDLFPSFADVYMTDRNMGGFYSKFMSWESYTRHNLSLFVVGVDYHTSYTQVWLFSHLNWWWGSSGWGVSNKSCSRVDRILWICFLILWSYESTPILMNCMRKMCVIITCGIVLCCLSLSLCVYVCSLNVHNEKDIQDSKETKWEWFYWGVFSLFFLDMN